MKKREKSLRWLSQNLRWGGGRLHPHVGRKHWQPFTQYVCSPLPDALPPRWDSAWAPPPGSCTGIASYSRPSAHQNLLYCHVCLMAVRLHQTPVWFSINYDSPRIFCYIYINGSHNNKDTNIIKCICIYKRFNFFFLIP